MRISRYIAIVVVMPGLHAGVASAQLGSVETRLAPAADSLEWFPRVTANSDDETYLRYLQISGAVPRYPWGLRAFSPAEAARLAPRVGVHPWSGRGTLTSRRRSMRLLPVTAQLRGNSSFPFGSNDGPVWAGRGVTASATAGLAWRAGPISLVLAPTAFIAQNASFDLLDNGHTDARAYGDGMRPNHVDRPQRFGDGAYGRVDPGNSTLRADVGLLAAGISTANMAWGPMELYPFVLGSNAPGFLHGFVGSSRPANVLIGSLHGRLVWGRLEQSAYSPVQGPPTQDSGAAPGTRRFASGMVLIFQPRGLSGLELGLARFYHLPWPSSGIPSSYFWKPLEGILKSRLDPEDQGADPDDGAENQLSSAFARWAFPSAGFEMYAEYGRDDHSWDLRDFSQEPDHARSYGLGFRKTLRLRPDRVDGLTVELINFQLPHLDRTGRGEGSIYVHGGITQGHTHRGQLLGADVGVGAAAGSTIRWDSYRARGRTSLSLQRTVRQQRGATHNTGVPVPRASDVQYALEAVRMRRLERVELTAGLALIHGFNRNFAEDATSVSIILGATVPLAR